MKGIFGKISEAAEERPGLAWAGIAFLCFLACVPLFGERDDTIDDPGRIMIGDAILAPKRIKLHGTWQQWDDVRITRGDLDGHADVLEIGRDWAIARGVSFPGAAAKILEIKNVRGGWANALPAWLEAIDDPGRAAEKGLPPLSCALARAEGVELADGGTKADIASLEFSDIDLPEGIGQGVARGVYVSTGGTLLASAAEISVGGASFPKDGDLSDLRIADLEISAVSFPEAGLHIGLIGQDMEKGRYRLRIGGFRLSDGAILDRMPGLPEGISGDADISAELLDGETAHLGGKMAIDGLLSANLDMVADASAGLADIVPGVFTLSVKDMGFVKAMDPQLKMIAMIAGGALLGPGLGEFLEKPGQAITVSGDLSNGILSGDADGIGGFDVKVGSGT